MCFADYDDDDVDHERKTQDKTGIIRFKLQEIPAGTRRDEEIALKSGLVSAAGSGSCSAVECWLLRPEVGKKMTMTECKVYYD